MRPVCLCLAFASFLAVHPACEKGDGASGRDAGAGAAGGTGGAAAGSGGQAGREAGTGGGGGVRGTGGSLGSGGAVGSGGASGAGSGGASGSGGGVAATGGAAPAVDARPADDADGGAPADGGRDAMAGDAGGGADAPPGRRPACPAGPFPAPMVQSSRAVCAGFAFNHTFNEGPTWIAGQNAFFFSNFIVRQPTGGDIIKYTPGGQCEIFIRDVGCNGLAVTPAGELLAACHQSRSVLRFDLVTKQPTTLADRYMGMLLDTPNDLVVHSNGTIYFTNPNYELGGRPAGVGPSVFRIDPAGMLSSIMRTPCNGIGLSPDERKLYVFQAGAWDLDPQGVPSARMNLFTNGDGMAIDCAGNLYSSSGTIFNAQGQQIGTFAGGTNLAFGGADGKTLLVVSGTQVRELAMNVPGLP